MGKTQVQPRDPRELNSSDIRREIDRTRTEMDATVNQLSQELQLQHLLDRFLGNVGSRGSGPAGAVARDAGQWLLTEIGRHPLPITVIGTGVAWLALQVKREREESRARESGLSGVHPMSSESGFEKSASPGLQDQMESCFESRGSDMAEQVKGRYQETKERLSRSTAGVRHRAAETADKLSHWSKEKWQRLSGKGEQAEQMAFERKHQMRERMAGIRSRLDQGRDRAAEILDEYPLFIGISALAIGVFIGMALPTSRRERRMLGSKASRWREEISGHAEHLIERGKEVAQATAEAIKDEARRQGLTPEGLKESARQVIREAGSTAQHEGLSPEGMVDKVEAVAEHASDVLKEETHRQEERL